jgi:hypothetical protein
VVYLVTQKGSCQQSCIDLHKGECSEKASQVGSVKKLMKCIKLVSLLLTKAMTFFVFLVSLRRVNQARGFQDMGATGILRFSLFFFQKPNLSNQLIQHPLPHTLPVVPVPIVAEDGYSCPNGAPRATICPFFILLAYILF